MFDKAGFCWVQSLITFLKQDRHNVCLCGEAVLVYREHSLMALPELSSAELPEKEKKKLWVITFKTKKTPEFMSTFVSVIPVCVADPYRKFSAVFGTTSANSSIFIRPRSWRADEKTLCEQLNTRNRDSVKERTTRTHVRWVGFASGKTQQKEKIKGPFLVLTVAPTASAGPTVWASQQHWLEIHRSGSLSHLSKYMWLV